MSLSLKINSVDKTSLVAWDSLQKVEVLTKEPDTLSFLIRNYDSKTYRPALSDDVTLHDGSTKIFGGVVIETREVVRGVLKYFEVQCKDYTQLLDQQLVSKNYTSQTVNAIISDIVSTFSSGFTVTNVNCTVTIATVSFNYVTISQALTQLTQLVGGFDWYVDYDKDIHFFQPDNISAPFSLDDTSGNFVWGSLEYKADTSQLRNFITVRGGTAAATQIIDKKVSDGVQLIYFVGYLLTSFSAFHALAASPTSFSTLTVGRDGIDDPTAYDCLYNPDLGLLRFPAAYPVGDVVKWQGIPAYPVIAQVQNTTSIAQYGTYQYVIVDKTITSRDAANKRAQAELLNYGSPVITGSFTTYSSGLRTGQTITINSTLRSINDSFKIQRITTTLRTPSATTVDYIFNVDFVSTVSATMIDVLNRLLIKDPANQIVVGQNEIIDRIYSQYETITIGETLTASKVHNPITETVTITEATNQAKNAGTIFVLGQYTPSSFADTKRQFVMNGSLLG